MYGTEVSVICSCKILTTCGLLVSLARTVNSKADRNRADLASWAEMEMSPVTGLIEKLCKVVSGMDQVRAFPAVSVAVVFKTKDPACAVSDTDPVYKAWPQTTGCDCRLCICKNSLINKICADSSVDDFTLYPSAQENRRNGISGQIILIFIP